MTERRTTIEILGLIVLTVSVLAVAYELYQARQLSISERLTAAGEVEASLRDLVVSNSSIWYRGCVGEELSPEEQIVFMHTFRALQYRSFTMWSIARSGTSAMPPETALDRMARSAAFYPGIRHALNSVKEDAQRSEIEEERQTIDFVDAIFARAEFLKNQEYQTPRVCGM